ncbi:Mu transposase C-terminal domain-containing protein [Gordonia sp. VNK21]|uniref:Mu transposase C-terminal domain-containing protein n=1 Tax=Gordonia sp. VNK21 TaxID=3382483 RepID=UPI0038D43941
MHTLVAISSAFPRTATLKDNATGEHVETALLEAIHDHADWVTPERPHDDPATRLALLPPNKQAKAVERAHHIREVLTGNPLGEPFDPLTCDHRYDPARYSVETRMQRKVEDLAGVRGYSRSSLYEFRRIYAETSGDISALAPGGIPVPYDPCAGLEEELLAAVQAIISDLHAEGESSREDDARLVLLKKRLLNGGVDPAHPALKKRRLTKIMKHFERGIPTKNAEQKRSKDSRNVSYVRRPKATQYLERVEVDATPLNVLVYDPDSKATFRPYVLVAICCATKLITLRLCAKQPTTRDVQLLLFDMLRPMVLPDRVRDHQLMLGVPQEVVIRQADELGAVVIDNGKEMINVSTVDLAMRFGIRIEGCRAGTGSDKGLVESANLTLDRVQQWLEGYVGRRSHQRGKDVQASLTYPAVEMVLQEYAYGLYPYMPHHGLPVEPHSAKLLTPAQAYERCFIRGSACDRVPHPDDVFQLLKSDVVAVSSDGVRCNGLKYTAPELRSVIREDDPTSKYASSIRIFYDKADRSRIFSYSTHHQRWFQLTAIHDNGQALGPCSDILMDGYVDYLRAAAMTEDQELNTKVAFNQFIDHVIANEPLRYAQDRAYLHSALPAPDGSPGAHYVYHDDLDRNRDFILDSDIYLADDNQLIGIITGGDDF